MNKVVFLFFVIGGFFLSCSTTSTQSDSGPDLDKGLIAHYTFNGNASDVSGNDHNGIINGALLTEDRHGVSNRAYSFDGVNNQYINVNNASLLNLIGESTISIWVNISTYDNRSNDSYWHILGKGAKAGWDSDGYCIFYHNEDQLLYGALTNKSQVPTFNRISFGKPTVNEWHHLTMVWDDTLMKAYLDGQQLGDPVQLTINLNQTSDDLIIGKKPYGTYNGYFDGIIDDIRLYNRALTDKEINYIYSGSL